MKLIVVSHESEIPREAEQIKALLGEGLELFHLRKPGWEEDRLLSFLDLFTNEELSCIVVHDHFQKLDRRPVSGIHLSEYKRSLLKNGKLAMPEFPVSSSFHTVDDIKNETLPLRYGFCGPVFDSISKSGYKGKSSALTPLHKTFPVIAIGGVSIDNISMLYAMNFDGAALCGFIWNSGDPVGSFKRVRRTFLQ